MSTSASIASAIGVARMPTHGSWRPCVFTTTARPDLSIVRRSRRIELRHDGETRGEEWIAVDVLPALERNQAIADLRQMAADRDPVALEEPLAGDAARRDPHGRLARRLAAAATIVADAVFLPVRVVGMAGAE